VASSCEHGDELSGSIKFGEFLVCGFFYGMKVNNMYT
jgi:hypothetical protein